MTTDEMCEQVLAWVQTTTEIETGYDHIPSQSTGPLPDCIVDAERTAIVPSSELFAQANIQQAWVRVWNVGVSIMVDNTDPDAGAEALRGYEDALTASLMSDGTLGGRVPMVSKRIEFDFTLPFVVRNDGLRGREMTANMTVAELVEEEG